MIVNHAVMIKIHGRMTNVLVSANGSAIVTVIVIVTAIVTVTEIATVTAIVTVTGIATVTVIVIVTEIVIETVIVIVNLTDVIPSRIILTKMIFRVSDVAKPVAAKIGKKRNRVGARFHKTVPLSK